jgi:putative CocE/NonD family hydrolase
MRSLGELMSTIRRISRLALLAPAAFGLLLLLAPLLRAQSAAQQSKAPYCVTVEHNVAAKMRDGITLRADIYRPKADGKFPVLLERTPYDKTGGAGFGMKAAARGYVVIIQDVRGRYASEGEWYTFKNESNDGYDTVEWAASLPYSDGKVGMFGGSYVGATQFLAAIASPPHLAGIAPYVTASNYHDGWTYQGGAFEQWFNQSWSSGLAQNTLLRAAERNSNALNWKNALPLLEYPMFTLPDPKALAPYYRDWLAHPNYDEYWKRLSIEEHYSQIRVPVFNIAAWYDIFLGGSLRNFELLKTGAGTEAARAGQKLFVGLGGHAGGWEQEKIGEVDFGKNAPFDGDEIMLEWYDHLLKGEENAMAGGKPVRIFVMGKNVWRDEDDWPLARAKATRFFLHSAGSANSSVGNGSLSTTAPATERSDSYVYDPADPVPTIGGPLCCDAAHLKPGPFDQKAAEQRQDVLVYTTEAFAKDTEVTGPVTLDLYASTSAVDTDFTAKLVDVWPNGFAQNLTEGILRLRYRNSQEKSELAKPGEIYRLTVDLWATSNVFLAGHRLRLEISSSNFPRFDRNLNTGEDQATGTKMVKAVNAVYHDKAHPSALILPVVPE